MKLFATGYKLKTVIAGLFFTLLSVSATAELSGNMAVSSKYIFRGITFASENDDTTLSGGLDYAHENGFYAGYWGANLGYASGEAEDADSGFENDLYLGYSKSFGDIGLDVSYLRYVYFAVDDADTGELTVSASYKMFSASMSYMTDDCAWSNQGDIYWAFSAETELPMGFGLAATLGYYTYEEEGEFITSSEESSGFRNLDLTLSHPIGETGADMSVTYIIGGDDRDGNEQDDAIVLGISYGFDIK